MNPFLIITGMHRSGTSFLARAFNLRGIHLGNPTDLISDDWRYTEDNVRGHWENKKFLELTNKTLDFNNGSWHKVTENVNISKELGEKIKKEIEELLKQQSLGSGIKDPRLIFCLDSWHRYLPKNFVLIAIFRNPLKVAESLKTRNNFSYKKSVNLWKKYNQKLLSLLETYDGFLLNFDWSKKRLMSEMDMISTKLELSKKIDFSDWLVEDLRQSGKTFDINYKLDAETKSLLSKLDERSQINKKIKIQKFTHKSKKHSDIIDNLLIDKKKQANYFRTLNEKNLKKIKNHSADMFNFQASLQKKEREVTNLESSLQKKEREVTKLKSSLQKKERQFTNIQASHDYLQKTLNEIHEKLTTKSLRKFYLIRKKLHLTKKGK